MATAKPSTYSEEGMRLRFWELSAERDAKLPLLESKRQERDDLVAAQDTKISDLNAEIKQLNYALAPIDEEMSRISRALSGRTGTSKDEPWSPESAEEAAPAAE